MKKYKLNWRIEQRCPDFDENTHIYQGQGHPCDEKLVLELIGAESFEIEIDIDELITLVNAVIISEGSR